MDEDLVALLTVLAVAVIAVALGYKGGQAMRARHVRQHFTASAAPSASPTAQQVGDFITMAAAMQGGPGRLASALTAGSKKLAKTAPDVAWPSCDVLVKTLVSYVDPAVNALNATIPGLTSGAPGAMAAAYNAAMGVPAGYYAANEGLNDNLIFYVTALTNAANGAASAADKAAGLAWAATVGSWKSSKNASGGQFLWFTPAGVSVNTVIDALFPPFSPPPQ